MIDEREPKLNVRDLSIDSLQAISNIHCRAFPRSLLTRYGFETVRRYYNWLFIGPHSYRRFGVYACDHLMGYSFSGTSDATIADFLIRNAGFLCFQVLRHIGWLLTDSQMQSRLKMGIQAVIAPSSQKHWTTPGIKQARLLVIATDPQYQKQGVGRLLLSTVETQARADGFNELGLTVHTDNDRAIKFYQHLGWQKKFDNKNWTGQMVKPL